MSDEFNDYKQRQKELIEDLSMIVEELGWLIAIPNEGEEMVQGLLIGTEQFLTEVISLTGQEAEVVEFDTTPAAPVSTKKQVH